MYWPTSVLTVNRYIGLYVGQYLLDSRPRCWFQVDSRPICWWHSLATVYWSKYFAEESSAYHQHLANVMADTLVEMLVDMSADASVEWQSSISCISIETWLVLDRYSLSVNWLVLCWWIADLYIAILIVDWYTTSTLLIVIQQFTNTLAMHYPCYRGRLSVDFVGLSLTESKTSHGQHIDRL